MRAHSNTSPIQIVDLTRLLVHGLLRHATEIRAIHGGGETALLFYSEGVTEGDSLRPDLGWTGAPSEVVPLTVERRRRLMDEIAGWPGQDPQVRASTLAWLGRGSGARAFAFFEDSCFCLDLDEAAQRWSIAPGTLRDDVLVHPPGLDPSFGPAMVRAAARAGDRISFRVNQDHSVELIGGDA